MTANNSPRKLAQIVLVRVRRDEAYASWTLDKELAKNDLDKKDSALATELVYGVLRNKLFLDYAISKVSDKSIKKIEPLVLDAIRIGAYQLLFLDKIPIHAAVDQSVRLVPKRVSGFVNAILRKLSKIKNEPPSIDEDDPVKKLSIETSHPVWIVEKYMERFGFDGTKALCQANQKPLTNMIRANSLRTNKEELISILLDKGIEAKEAEFASMGIEVEKLSPLINPVFLNRGLYMIQGEAPQLVTELLAPKPGDKILDACAAPGTKTTHIAQMMQNDGQIIASDVSQDRLVMVRQNAERLGVKIITSMAADLTRKPPSRMEKNFDGILVDAPCSGLGDLGKNPEARYRKTPESVESIQVIQRLILENVAPLVKPGGTLVYSTCTLTMEENEGAVNSFLKRHPDFMVQNILEILGEKCRLFATDNGHLLASPHITGTGGFFAARLIKRKP